jgi:hypothetical protein
MPLTIHLVRAFFAEIAALLVAGASIKAPVSELAEDLHHADVQALDCDGHGARDAAGGPGDQPSTHQHPDTPGHTDCGASCHVQLPDQGLAVAVAFAANNTFFAVSLDAPHAASHLDGLFRPPRV